MARRRPRGTPRHQAVAGVRNQETCPGGACNALEGVKAATRGKKTGWKAPLLRKVRTPTPPVRGNPAPGFPRVTVWTDRRPGPLGPGPDPKMAATRGARAGRGRDRTVSGVFPRRQRGVAVRFRCASQRVGWRPHPAANPPVSSNPPPKMLYADIKKHTPHPGGVHPDPHPFPAAAGRRARLGLPRPGYRRDRIGFFRRSPGLGGPFSPTTTRTTRRA